MSTVGPNIAEDTTSLGPNIGEDTTSLGPNIGEDTTSPEADDDGMNERLL